MLTLYASSADRRPRSRSYQVVEFIIARIAPFGKATSDATFFGSSQSKRTSPRSKMMVSYVVVAIAGGA